LFSCNAASERFEHSAAMDHGDDEYRVIYYAIDHAEAINEKLTDGVVTELRNDPASIRKPFQLERTVEDFLNDRPRINRRVALYVLGDRFDVIYRGR
jgi:hypothetical protein